MKRRPFRPTLNALEPRIALSSSSSSIFKSLFGSLFGTNSSSQHHKQQHSLAYYEKLAPTNAHAAHIVQVVMQRREHAAELRAAHAGPHVHA
jgi:hypothetical protein